MVRIIHTGTPCGVGTKGGEAATLSHLGFFFSYPSTLSMADAGGLPRRIQKETERLVKDPIPGISAAPFEVNFPFYAFLSRCVPKHSCASQDNLRYFNVCIEGPPDTPFEGLFSGASSVIPCANPAPTPSLCRRTV